MGWRGTLRSVNAELNRQAKRDAKRQREIQKYNELQAASSAVSHQENFLENIVSLHHHCNAKLDWHEKLSEQAPKEPEQVTKRAAPLQVKLESFKGNVIDRVLKTVEWRRKRLQKKILKAQEADTKEFERLHNQFQKDRQDWVTMQALARRVVDGDYKAYMEVIKDFSNFKGIALGNDLQFKYSDKGFLAFDLYVMKQEEVIPEEEYNLRASGTLSTKKMAKTKGIDIYQDHVCSCLLRVCREVFGLLPVPSVQANAVMKGLNTQTGHLEDMIIVSADVKRETLLQLSLENIDPSDSFRNFVHNMKFTKSKGFDFVQRIEEL